MFRYIDQEGTDLTEHIIDLWRLPSVDEYLQAQSCDKDPDKEAPLWARDMEVIYYWTSTISREKYAYNISYSARAREILKTTKQDYRGFRTIRQTVH